MNFLTIEPEIAGAPVGSTPPGHLTCAFDTWLGDDLVRAFPVLLATTPLKTALLKLRGRSGFEVQRARVRASPFFRKHNPGKRLPPFFAITVSGKAGRDDFGLTAAGVLVVSRRILDVLLGFRIGRALVGQYIEDGSRS